MRLPTIEGTIRRRILVNYRVDPAVIQRHLPSRFRPKLYEGRAVAGICLIRLEHIRPKILPAFIGINSENAAHRIAVLWDDEQGVTREGVFIPRRDTNSEINHLMGGRIFPGEHNKAAFTVQESETEISFSMESRDGEVKSIWLGESPMPCRIHLSSHHCRPRHHSLNRGRWAIRLPATLIVWTALSSKQKNGASSR